MLANEDIMTNEELLLKISAYHHKDVSVMELSGAWLFKHMPES